MGSLTISWDSQVCQIEWHTGGESKGAISLAFVSSWLTKLDLQEEDTSRIR